MTAATRPPVESAGGRHATSSQPREPHTWTRETVLAVGGAMVLAQVAFRAWVVYPAWFFLDDYVYLEQARASGLDAAYLLEAYGGHLMPGARLIAWAVAHAGPMAWGLAATITLLLQALTSAACLWSLVRIFGGRPGVLVPLALYLSTALTLPGYVWWAAAINLLPVQLTMFVAVTAWIEHLRASTPAGRRRWLALTIVAVLTGMSFDVRGALVLPVLGFVAAAWFASGGPGRRAAMLLRRHGAGVAALVLLGAAYSAYYLVNVEQQTTLPSWSKAGDIAGTMLGQTFPTALLGGPWHWQVLAPPTSFTDPPVALVVVAWLVLATVVLALARRRTRTLRAWALLWGYAATLTALVVSSRSELGPAVGRELRFLTETGCLLALTVGLATMRLPGAVECSEARAQRRWGWAPIALAAVVVAGALVSSVGYARTWHTDNASQAYVQHLRDDLRDRTADAGAIDLAQTPVPEVVLSHLVAPANNSRTFAHLLDPDASFPAVTDALVVVDDDGRLRRAEIDLGVSAAPGPVPGCGWQATGGAGVRIPLSGEVLGYESWLRLAYLASQDATVRLSSGTETASVPVRRGLGDLYVKVDGGFDTLAVGGLDPGTTLCLDRVEVGRAVAGGEPS